MWRGGGKVRRCPLLKTKRKEAVDVEAVANRRADMAARKNVNCTRNKGRIVRPDRKGDE